MVEISQEPTYTLAEARKTVGLSQNKLKRKSGVSKTSIVNCEGGKSIQRGTAIIMLLTINEERTKVGLPPILERQMTWNLREYKREEQD